MPCDEELVDNARVGALGPDAHRLAVMLDAAMDRATMLRRALSKHGAHGRRCEDGECVCGLSDAIALGMRS
jgi:hypothetical protein